MSDDEIDTEIEEGYDEFIKEYGDMNGIMKGILDLYQSGKNGMIFFAQSKHIGRLRQLGIGRRKRLSNLYIACLV